MQFNCFLTLLKAISPRPNREFIATPPIKLSVSYSVNCIAPVKISFVKSFGDVLLTIAVLGGILVISAVLTNLYARAMYFQCRECRALNAKRRTHCRVCGNALAGKGGSQT
jgi:hypothetical protein